MKVRAGSNMGAVEGERLPQEVGVAGLDGRADDEIMTTTEDNKTIVDEFIQALFTTGDLSAVDRYLADKFVAHDPPMRGLSGDAAGFRDAAATIRAAFPDWRSDVHLLLAEGDYVVERFTASGTHRGEFMGTAPSHRRLTMPGINIFGLQDGKIVERWGILDVLGFLTQLGVIPEPAEATTQPAGVTSR
jgi:steroid delta-isomerase-like uncharacterized protein